MLSVAWAGPIRSNSCRGIPGATLMENAGRGATDALLRALPERGLRVRGLRVAIVCGKGGNGAQPTCRHRQILRVAQR